MTEKDDPHAINVIVPGDSNPKRAAAEAYLNPATLAVSSIKQFYTKEGGVDVNALIAELEKQADQVHNGDLKRAETMLVAQAHVLDALFLSLQDVLGRILVSIFMLRKS